jgi:hypothetical protein
VAGEAAVLVVGARERLAISGSRNTRKRVCIGNKGDNKSFKAV